MTGPASRNAAAGQSGTRAPGGGRVAGWFEACYGAPPEGVWMAPGRVNLIGEHTDYNDGLVLPFALDRGVLVAGSRRGDALLEVRSRQAGGEAISLPLAEIAPGAVAGWAAYPAGVVWAMREAGLPVGGASLAVDSSLPQGAGLSSSAALECAAALALADLNGLRVSRPELAAIARRAENAVVGVPSGIMDQSASLLCRAGHAMLLDCRSGEHQAVPLQPSPADLALLVIDTKARRALADGRYARRRAECEAAARALGKRSLREADEADLSRLGDDLLLRRARHVVTENERVRAAAAALRKGDIRGVGPLLSASHASLARDFEVSWREADAAVDAVASAGALGARMMGGGFGGSVLVLAPVADEPLRVALDEAFAGHGWAPPAYLSATPSASARRLR